MRRRYFLLFIFILACKKDLDITEFSSDFADYKPELRIEALILPDDSIGAIIRIDGVTQTCASGCSGPGYTYTPGTSKFKIEMTSADVKFYEDVAGNGSWSLKIYC